MKRIALAAALLLAAAARRRRRPPRGRARRRRAHGLERLDHRLGERLRLRTPTSAAFSFGVDDPGRDREGGALAANAREMRQVIAAVKAAGGRDVGTLSISLSQMLGQNGRRTASPPRTPSRRPSTSIAPGALIDAAVEAGANQVNGPSCPSPTREPSTARRSRLRWPRRDSAPRRLPRRPAARSAR